MLYDIYHMQIMDGNLIQTITNNIELIGHFHAAGVPGRHEISNGELNYRYIFDRIEKSGYKGFVGLEYIPALDSAESLRQAQGCLSCF
ncbi:MAG: Hydroxypyruvate isomerase [candidate division WS2 bacterium]|nr:Hydroxypyruvate isomerase [Candidatus Psychracetigena formicireducens]